MKCNVANFICKMYIQQIYLRFRFNLRTSINSIIVEKIDENKDGFVSLYELKSWISYTQKRYIDEDVNRQWKQHNPENEEKLAWEVSRILMYML